MAGSQYALLPQRGLLSVSGDDAKEFLQGIISNDINKVTATQAIWAAFLTPQGKYLFDFFVAELDGKLVIDCEAERLPEFMKKLKMYKLRSKAELADISEDYEVFAIFGGETEGQTIGGGLIYADPRLVSAGARAMMPKGTGAEALNGLGIAPSDANAYDTHRLALGLPDGSRDMIIDKSILLENGFEELNGVDWDKGCYMGQELTARTKYRGLIKKRLIPVSFDGVAPAPGTAIRSDDGKEAGEMRSAYGSKGLALIRLEALEKGSALEAEGTVLTASKPDWAEF